MTDFRAREAFQAEVNRVAADDPGSALAMLVDAFQREHAEHPQYADALDEHYLVRMPERCHHRGNPESYMLCDLGDYALAHRWAYHETVVWMPRPGWDCDLGYVAHLRVTVPVGD